MTVEELERFNKANDISDWLKHYKDHKRILSSKVGLTVHIEESYGDQNKSSIILHSASLKRPELFNKAVEAFFDTIIGGLEKEFKEL